MPSLRTGETEEPLSANGVRPMETAYLPGYDSAVQDHRVAGFQRLPEEVAVAISYNGLNHAVMMATPTHLEDYAAGFSISSGIIDAPKDILDIAIEHHGDSAVVDITVTQRVMHNLKRSRRALAGSSGCGLCGVEALDQALAQPRQRATLPHRPLPPDVHLRELRERFQRAQQHLRQSGAMHAALYVDTNGETLLCREDIGRHNALDKLLGACVKSGVELETGFVAITSRCGLELIQKAVGAGVGTLVSLSAPTEISVRRAREQRLNLIHQPAFESHRIYSPLAKG